MTTKQISLSEQIRKIPVATRPIVEAAIKTVKEIAPQAQEITYGMKRPPEGSAMMWKIVRYAVDGENVVGVGTFSQHASMFFYRGRELDDATGMLQGTGKNSQFVTLRTAADAGRPAVQKLVREAFERRASKK